MFIKVFELWLIILKKYIIIYLLYEVVAEVFKNYKFIGKRWLEYSWFEN